MIRRGSYVIWLGAGLLASCTGRINDLATQDPAGGTGGSGQKGSGRFGSGLPSPDTGLWRLTRTEYSNTLRDLLGDNLQSANRLPADHPYVNGLFDNDAETLSSIALDLDAYESIATDVVEGAFSKNRARLLPGCNPVAAGCARSLVAAFARRAWRRPVDGPEVDQLMASVQMATAQGDSAEEGVKLAFRAALVSPNFFYRVETSNITGRHDVSAHELATRLSYFIWASTPDDQLLDLADKGTLGQPDVLTAQLRRMMADGRADALATDFAGQLLSTSAMRDGSQVAPSKVDFPSWDEALREPMAAEPERFFAEMLEHDGRPGDLLGADFTFVNDKLARHYSLQPVTGSAMQKVTLPPDKHRFGILTHAAMLTATSNANRTVPVKRGKWVAFRLLCIPPKELPPNVPPLKDAKILGPTATIRDLYKDHAQGACAGCHAVMDPFGFALEHYDGIGMWRSRYKNNPVIDATGIYGGQDFDGLEGPRGLAQVLKNDPDLARCFTRNVFAYALGRNPKEPGDLDAIEAIGAEFAKGGSQISALISLIASSDAFKKRGGLP